MKEELFQLAIRSAEQEEIGRMLACNKKLEAYGLTLREEDAKALLAEPDTILAETRAGRIR